jgi:hypothetical protein
MKLKRAIEIQKEEYNLHYKGVGRNIATKAFLDIGRSLKVLIDIAERCLKKADRFNEI